MIGALVSVTAMVMVIVSLIADVPLTRTTSIAWLKHVGIRYIKHNPPSANTTTSDKYYSNQITDNEKVYSCEYQLFIQQYFAICPSAREPIPFWPAPDNAPNRCSCDLGKVLQTTLTARKEQVSCVRNVTDKTLDKIPSDLGDLDDLPNGLDIANDATNCACCGASAAISA